MDQPWLWMLFAVSGLLYWWAGVGLVRATPEEFAARSSPVQLGLYAAMLLSRLGLVAVALLGAALEGWGLLFPLLVAVFIGLMALGPHPLESRRSVAEEREAGEHAPSLRSGVVEDARGAVRWFEVASGGHPGVLGCVSAMGCVVAAFAGLGLVILLVQAPGRIDRDELRFQAWATTGVIVFALAVFGWAGRRVRIELVPEGFRVTRIVLRFVRFRTLIRAADVTSISTGLHLSVTEGDLPSTARTFHCCRIARRGWARDLRFAHAEPRENQKRLVRELRDHLESLRGRRA